jgi:hypothetical protein
MTLIVSLLIVVGFLAVWVYSSYCAYGWGVAYLSKVDIGFVKLPVSREDLFMVRMVSFWFSTCGPLAVLFLYMIGAKQYGWRI